MAEKYKIIFALAACLLVQHVYADGFGLPENPIIESRSAFSNPNIQRDLQSILSAKDYKVFQDNLVEYSASYNLKSGDRYYEARKNALKKFALASAMVVSPDGFYYISYYYANRYIKYITNDYKCSTDVHAAVKIFARHYPENTKIMMRSGMKNKISNHDCSKIYGNEAMRKELGYFCAGNVCKRNESVKRNGKSPLGRSKHLTK